MTALARKPSARDRQRDASKPTLGFQSKTEAVAAMISAGLAASEIAERLGISSSAVSALRCYAVRRSGSFSPASELTNAVLVSDETLFALAPHAARRKTNVRDLARRIIETVVDDKMVDAVLDDGVTV